MIDRIKENEANGKNQQNDSDNPAVVPSGQVSDGLLQLPAKSFYVVQAGAFSDLNAARDILQEHKEKGWAGLLLEGAAPYKFYIGIASSKEQAKLLGSYYEGKVPEIYVKEHSTPDVKGAIVRINQQLLAKLPSFLAKGEQLIDFLGDISSNGLYVEGYELAAPDWQEIQELHRTFLQEGREIFGNWKGEGKGSGEQLLHQLTQGVNALETYKKQKHTSYLWQVQQSSLQYLLEYEKLIASLE